MGGAPENKTHHSVHCLALIVLSLTIKGKQTTIHSHIRSS